MYLYALYVRNLYIPLIEKNNLSATHLSKYYYGIQFLSYNYQKEIPLKNKQHMETCFSPWLQKYVNPFKRKNIKNHNLSIYHK